MKIVTFSLFILLFSFITNGQTVTDVVSGLKNPNDLIRHGDFLYFSQSNTGVVSRVDITQKGSPSVDVVTGIVNPDGLAIKGDTLFIASNKSGIIYIKLFSTQSTTPTEFITGLNSPSGILIHDDLLFICEHNVDKVSKVDLTDPSLQVVPVLSSVDAPQYLAYKDGEIYVTLYGEGRVIKFDPSLQTPNVVEVLKDLMGPTGIDIVNDEMFIVEANESRLITVDLLTKTLRVIYQFDNSTDFSWSVLVDGNKIYVSQSFGAKISLVDETVNKITVQGENGISVIDAEKGTLKMLAVVEPDEAIDKSVRWSVTDGTGSATIDPTTGLLTALTDGTVIVKATAKDASSTVGQIEITISNQVTTSLSNTSLANKFNVYPNPSVDEINIESQGLAIESISLIDIKGNIIKVVSTNEKINISDLPKGIYILKIQSGNDVINKRFVKE